MLKQIFKMLLIIGLLLIFTYGYDFISTKYFDKPLADTGTYQVTKVFDGDTIEVKIDGNYEKVRFIGVDTPETGGHDTQIECYGPEASAFMKNLLEGERVKLTADPRSNNRDLYDRLLRFVERTSDGLDVNLELIKQGYSKAYLVFPHTRNQEFANASNEAKIQGVGLWSECQNS